jgi:Transposase IS66 family/Ku70/Ku80 beta-barrel domain
MAPPRPYWKGYPKLSLVSCPISVYTATSSTERVAFRQINKKTGNRLKQQLVDEETGDVVDASDKGRGFEVSKGAYVVIECYENINNECFDHTNACRRVSYRLAARQTRSKPIVDAFHIWLEQQLPRISGRSTLAEAMRYALVRWDGLTRFLHDGRIELDTNPVERAIRPVALGRKNHLFAGSDGGGARWAIVRSLIQTAKLNDVEP